MGSRKVPKNVIELAKAYAEKSTMKHKIGAVVYKDGKIIGKGFNKWLRKGSKNHPELNYSIHAEIDAIRGVSLEKLYGASIYIHRSNSKLAKPCGICMHSLMRNGITEIHWSE